MEDFLDKGWWLYGEDRVLIQQSPDAIGFFRDLLLKEQFGTIIELGTSFAGLTVVLSDLIREFSPQTRLISYDNATRHGIPELAEKYNFDYREKSIGEEETDLEIIQEITQTFLKTLVLCDGGSKVYEFNKFSAYLKSGDVIGAHDYADDIAFFEEHMKDRLWNWMEIEYKHIEGAINANNLEDLGYGFTERGKKVAWIMKKRF